MSTDPIGQTLDDRYELRRVLGRGGMSIVYEARHRFTGRRVAVKVLTGDYASSPEARERLLREALALGSLRNRYVVDVLDAGLVVDVPYVVTELLDGRSLEGLVTTRGRLSCEDTARIARQVCSALTAAHARGLLHRDVKSANVIVVQGAGGEEEVRLLDFGVSHVPHAAPAGPRLTTQESLLGTPEYMAPEQVNAQYGKIEGRTDLYAAGILFYRMLAGTLPFRRDRRDQNDWMRVCVQHVNDRPPPLPASVPPALRQITMRLLEKQQLDRFPDAAALLQALHGWGSAHRPPAALLGGSAVLGACLLAWLGWWLARVPATPAQSGLRGPPPPAPAALAPPPAPPGAVAANRALAVPAEGDAAAPRSSLPLSVQPPATKVQTKTRPTPASRAHASQPAAPSDPWATPEELSEKVRDACRNKDAEQARTYFLRLRSAERGNTEIICRDRRLRWEQSSLRYATVEQAITPGLEARGVG